VSAARAARAHAAALLLAAGGIAVGRLASPFLDTYTVLPSVAAVLLAAWGGGLGPGLLATLASLLGINFVLVPPAWQLARPDASDAVRLGFFALLSVGASYASARVRAAARALRESEARARLVTEGVRDYAIFTLDPAGHVASWNLGAAQLLGYEAGEVVGRAHAAFFPPDAAAAAEPQREMERAAAHGRVELEAWRVRKDGTRFWASVVMTAMRGRDGALLGYSKIIRDLTERRAAEESLRRLNRELSATTYAIAHDLRSPLRALDGYAYLLAQQADGRLDDEGRDLLASIRATSRRMADLLDGLLSLARVSREPLALEEVDLGALAERALADARAASPGRRIEGAVAHPLHVRGDPRLLAVVVQNLVDNAVKFTAGREPAHVEVGGTRVGGARAVFVRDDGVGFDPAHAAQLFRPFHRLHRADEFPGHGIGLATVERIVTRHGGRVWAEGRPGEGAVIYFTLPEDGADASEDR
jgi:hypothetical protein